MRAPTGKRPGKLCLPTKHNGTHLCIAGTELTLMLHAVGFTYTDDCDCRSRATQMDRNGCDWCEANIDTIVGWMKEGFVKQKAAIEARIAKQVAADADVIDAMPFMFRIPFSETAAKLMVNEAIRRARRKVAAHAQQATRGSRAPQ